MNAFVADVTNDEALADELLAIALDRVDTLTQACSQAKVFAEFQQGGKGKQGLSKSELFLSNMSTQNGLLSACFSPFSLRHDL